MADQVSHSTQRMRCLQVITHEENGMFAQRKKKADWPQFSDGKTSRPSEVKLQEHATDSLICTNHGSGRAMQHRLTALFHASRTPEVVYGRLLQELIYTIWHVETCGDSIN